jgi:hypothetical protein
MPIADFTRAYYAMNKVLDDASTKAGLSKRAAVLLLILHDAPDRMETADLVRNFESWNVSTSRTAAKDVSIAKGELFQNDLVAARGGIRNIEVTEKGRRRASDLVSAIEQALRDMLDRDSENSLLAKLMLETVPRIPRKPVGSARPEGQRKTAQGAVRPPRGAVG